MKKTIAILTIGLLCAGILVGCTENGTSGEETNGTTVTTTTTTSATANPTTTTESKKTIEIGDVVNFGSYEQNNIQDDGKEQIQWFVLDKQEDKALLLSVKGLDYQAYNTANKAVTWETCSLRKWLNETFLNEAFSLEEQEAVFVTTLTNADSSGEGTNGGNDTEDRVFLLSYKEVNQYLSRDGSIVKATAFTAKSSYDEVAETQWVYFNEDCTWWLRSIARSNNKYAASIGPAGNLGFCLDTWICTRLTIRPAVWVDIARIENMN